MDSDFPFPTAGFVRLSQIIGDRKRGVVGPIPVSRSTWWAGVKTGRFPQPVKIGPKTTAWRVSDISNLLATLNAVKETANG